MGAQWPGAEAFDLATAYKRLLQGLSFVCLFGGFFFFFLNFFPSNEQKRKEKEQQIKLNKN